MLKGGGNVTTIKAVPVKPIPSQVLEELKINRMVFDKLGITEWHESGITGKGDILDIWEKLTEGVILPTGPDEAGIAHAAKVKEYFNLFAPDSKVNIKDYRITAISNVETDIVNMSLTGSAFLGYQAEEQRRVDEGVLLVTSSGNKGRDPYPNLTFSATKTWWIPITALHYEKAYDHFVKPVYASSGPNLSNGFCGVAGLYLPEASVNPIGTSFASPSFVGMVFLYRQWYKDRFKKYPSKENALAFMRLISKQPEEYNGQSEMVGVGLPHLPKLAWMESNKSKIRTLGENTIILDIGYELAEAYGEPYTLDSPPTIINSRTMVPLRFIAENLNCKITWIPGKESPNGKGRVIIEPQGDKEW